MFDQSYSKQILLNVEKVQLFGLLLNSVCTVFMPPLFFAVPFLPPSPSRSRPGVGRCLKGNIYSQDGTGDPNWSKIYPVACNVMLVIKTEGENQRFNGGHCLET